VGERVPLGLRVTPELKRKLDAAAEQTGRSQSQEAELRLEHTFDRQELLPEILTLAYGSKEIAGIVMTVGFTLFEMHRRVEAHQFHPLAKVSKPDVAASYALDQAIKAAVYVLEAMRPRDAPEPEDTHPELYPSWSARFANDVIRAVRGDVVTEASLVSSGWMQSPVRSMLGKIAKRMKAREPSQKGELRHE
jgi:hypothetical protein